MDKNKVKKIVKEAYGKIAKEEKSASCCSSTDTRKFAKSIGYTDEEVESILGDANLSLGCGNPTSIANLKEGEVVLDLGSGAGFDSFLAAKRVGEKGKVIGIDMTQEMVNKARDNAKTNGVANVEFKVGEIEKLPIEDSSIDVVISNCVINLSSDKQKVFDEIYRVLKPGGRIAISDIALVKELPEKIRNNIEAYVGCIGGAISVYEYGKAVKSTGLNEIKVTISSSSCITPDTKDPIGRSILDGLGKGESIADYIVSIYVEGRK